jgi:hypothetical protein
MGLHDVLNLVAIVGVPLLCGLVVYVLLERDARKHGDRELARKRRY